jgi:hypothetical protein
MADGLDITQGSGTKINTDEISSVHTQRVKVGWGVDGVYVDCSDTNPLPISIRKFNAPATTPYKQLSVTNHNIKSSPGRITSVYLSSSATAERSLKFFDKASSATLGTDTPAYTYKIPAGAAGNLPVDRFDPMEFSTGISIACTTGLADNSSSQASANEMSVMIKYE